MCHLRVPNPSGPLILASFLENERSIDMRAMRLDGCARTIRTMSNHLLSDRLLYCLGGLAILLGVAVIVMLWRL